MQASNRCRRRRRAHDESKIFNRRSRQLLKSAKPKPKKKESKKKHNKIETAQSRRRCVREYVNGIISCCYYIRCLKYLMLLNACDAHRSRLTPFPIRCCVLPFRSHFPKRLGWEALVWWWNAKIPIGETGNVLAAGAASAASAANARLMAALCLVETGEYVRISQHLFNNEKCSASELPQMASNVRCQSNGKIKKSILDLNFCFFFLEMVEAVAKVWNSKCGAHHKYLIFFRKMSPSWLR